MVETAFSAPYQKNNPYAVMRNPGEVHKDPCCATFFLK